MSGIEDIQRRFYLVCSSPYRLGLGRPHPVHGHSPGHRRFVAGCRSSACRRRRSNRPGQRLIPTTAQRRYAHDHPDRHRFRPCRPDPGHVDRPALGRPHLKPTATAKNKARGARLPRLFLCSVLIKQHVEQDITVVQELTRHLDVFRILIGDTLQTMARQLPDVGVGIAEDDR